MKNKLFAVLSGIVLACTSLNTIAEVLPGTDLSVNFESGHIVGSGRHLNMQRIPVTDLKTGTTTLYDASFKFTFLPADGFIFEEITSAIVSPPVIAPTNIIPGVYVGTGGRCYILEGPAGLTNARSVYTFRSYKDNSCTTSGDSGFVAQITSGSANGHPDIGGRDIVSNLQDTYLYGLVTARGKLHDIFRGFETHGLVGLRQLNNTLTVNLFSKGVNGDGTPADFKDAKKTVTLIKFE